MAKPDLTPEDIERIVLALEQYAAYLRAMDRGGEQVFLELTGALRRFRLYGNGFRAGSTRL